MSYYQVMITEFGGPDVLEFVEEATLPEPAANEVRIKVQATSACFTDTMVRKGVYYDLKKKPPFPPGYDVVGVVDKLGTAVSHLKVGQTVADLTVSGAYSEYMCRPERSLVPVPDGLDPAEAVSLVLRDGLPNAPSLGKSSTGADCLDSRRRRRGRHGAVGTGKIAVLEDVGHSF